MRPSSIVQFDIVFWMMMATQLVVQLLTWDEAMAQFRTAAGTDQLGGAFPILVSAAGYAVNLLLWYFVSRVGSGIARWLYVALFVLSVAGVLLSAAAGIYPAGLRAVTTAGLIALNALAVWLLFRPDASAWFRGEEAPPAAG